VRRFNHKASFKIVLASTDVVMVASGFIAAYWIRFGLPFFQAPYFPPAPDADVGSYARFSLFIGFVGFVTLYSAGMYRLQQPFFGIDDFFSIIKAVTLSHLIAAAIGFAVRGRISGEGMETYSRIVIAMSWLLGIVVLTFWRLGFDVVLTAFRRRGVGLTSVLIVGKDEFGQSFHDLLKGNSDLGYNPVGLIDEKDEEGWKLAFRTVPIDEVMMASKEMDPQRVMLLMGDCQEARIPFSMIPTLFHVLTSRIQVREVAGVPIFAMEERIFLRSSRILKRTIDLVLAEFTLIVTSPLVGLIVAMIKLESHGPIVIKQIRVGKRAKTFTCYKFRSMRADAEKMKTELEHMNEAQGPLFKIRNDPRITRVGRMIRKFSIDEVPQLVNVIKGDMSLVGPRPPLPTEVDQYETWQRKRFEVLPGMTGLAQISGRSDLNFDETLQYDFYYIEN